MTQLLDLPTELLFQIFGAFSAEMYGLCRKFRDAVREHSKHITVCSTKHVFRPVAELVRMAHNFPAINSANVIFVGPRSSQTELLTDILAFSSLRALYLECVPENCCEICNELVHHSSRNLLEKLIISIEEEDEKCLRRKDGSPKYLFFDLPSFRGLHNLRSFEIIMYRAERGESWEYIQRVFTISDLPEELTTLYVIDASLRDGAEFRGANLREISIMGPRSCLCSFADISSHFRTVDSFSYVEESGPDDVRARPHQRPAELTVPHVINHFSRTAQSFKLELAHWRRAPLFDENSFTFATKLVLNDTISVHDALATLQKSGKGKSVRTLEILYRETPNASLKIDEKWLPSLETIQIRGHGMDFVGIRHFGLRCLQICLKREPVRFMRVEAPNLAIVQHVGADAW